MDYVYMTPPLLTQGSPSTIATLQYRERAEPIIPQAGTLPPIGCPEEDQACPAVDADTLFWLLLAGAGLLLISQRQKGEKRGASS